MDFEVPDAISALYIGLEVKTGEKLSRVETENIETPNGKATHTTRPQAAISFHCHGRICSLEVVDVEVVQLLPSPLSLSISLPLFLPFSTS